MTPTPRERPVILDLQQVRALKAGLLRQIWLPISPQPAKSMRCMAREIDINGQAWFSARHISDGYMGDGDDYFPTCPCGKDGDRLWVQEPWARTQDYRPVPHPEQCPPVYYEADNNRPIWAGLCWRKPQQMPRWASRFTLEVMGVIVSRVTEVTWKDAWAAGIVLVKRIMEDTDGKEEQRRTASGTADR